MGQAEQAVIGREDLDMLKRQLGREPRGVRAIEQRCPVGHPHVIKVYPLLGVEPFPTLFWLTCPSLIAQISQLEHQGTIQVLERRIAEDDVLRERYHEAHRAYIKERWEELSTRDRAWIKRMGYESLYLENGIGGIRNWDTLKCLHLHYAHHLARENVVGEWIDEHFQILPCTHDPASSSD